jgi:YVTN family beta-propeller protein
MNVGKWPDGIAVAPDGTKAYVANMGSNNVSVIDTANNTVTATVNVGKEPNGVSVSPDGAKVYVVNFDSNTISIIDTATDSVTATVSVGNSPIAFGQFIGTVQ